MPRRAARGLLPQQKLREASDWKEDNVEEEEEQREEGSGAASLHSSEALQPAINKKKNKNKKQKKKIHGETASEAAGTVKAEDIDAIVEEVNRLLGPPREVGTTFPQDRQQETCEFTVRRKALLKVEPKYLIADGELRRLLNFHADHKFLSHRNRNKWTRQSHLVKMVWPRPDEFVQPGISMSVCEGSGQSTSGEQCFTFEHSQKYQKLQYKFLDFTSVSIIDRLQIDKFHFKYPHHINCMIEMSKIFRFDGRYQDSAEIIEYALSVFQAAFHPHFNLVTGNCRLDFRRKENRPFYVALFRYLVDVSWTESYRTSLELCKVLLSLDPDDDPMGVLLMIDFYAIKSQEYTYLLRLFEEWESSRNLSHQPNFAFSVALALYYLGKKNPSMACRADSMLEESLLMFPAMLFSLLPTHDDITDPSWKKIAEESLEYLGVRELDAIYRRTSSVLWKAPDVKAWLIKTAKSAMECVHNNDPRVAEFAEKWAERYTTSSRNVHRHFLLCADVLAVDELPEDVDNLGSYSDPLPPLDAVESYTRHKRYR